LALVLAPFDEEGEEAVIRRLAAARSIDGIIITRARVDVPRVPLLKSLGIPFVVHGRTHTCEDYAFVDIDNEAVFFKSASLLLNLGHRRIVMLNGLPEFKICPRPRFCETMAFAFDTPSIDILVSNAGGSRQVPVIAPETTWEEAFALNFSVARRLAEAVLPRMRARCWGRVINISGLMEPRTLNAASAAKAALHLWTRGLSCDVAADGVTVNTIPPGRINSEQTLTKLHPSEDARQAFVANNIPAGYFGEPQDIGHLVALLLHRLRDISRGQSFRWMGACIISRTDVQAMH
jgi:NAD(P)-dependent dehydrogenase (short-subunit alcohol dehydrogenase family)